jgi:ribosomal protein L11 methyltransferase
MSDHRQKLTTTPASWLQVQIDLGDIPPGPLEHALLELGAVSIEYGDAGDEPIFEPDPDTTPLWQYIRITALFNAGASEIDVRLAIAGSTSADNSPFVRFSIVEEQDWVSKWKQSLQPTMFGANLWICPPDTPCPAPGGVAVTMEPGLAFGTGSHPTTALCLDWLATQPLADKSILDYGCGSGILGIAGIALGARQVTAVDIDRQALTATHENALRNQFANRIRIQPSDLLDTSERFDVIVANILSGTLVELAPVLKAHSRSGTRIALSGILTSQISDVSDAYREWVTFNPSVTRREWAIMVGTAA